MIVNKVYISKKVFFYKSVLVMLSRKFPFLTGPPQFNTPLSSTPQFNTKGPLVFSPQNPSVPHSKPLSSTQEPLSSTPKSPQFHTKIFRFLVLNWETLGAEKVCFLCCTEGVCVELRVLLFNCFFLILAMSFLRNQKNCDMQKQGGEKLLEIELF